MSLVTQTTLGEGFTSPIYRAGLVDLLGVLAYSEIVAFERMATGATLAPTVAEREMVASLAAVELNHHRALVARLDELGVDVDTAITPFREPIDDFHERTAPSSWLEALVKIYVGDTIAADFYRVVAASLDPRSREVVLASLADAGHREFVVGAVRSGVAADPAVAGRLALWARRLVGEALSQAQRIAAQRETMAALLVGSPGSRDTSAPAPVLSDLADIGRLLVTLTAAHEERMVELGLSS